MRIRTWVAAGVVCWIAGCGPEESEPSVEVEASRAALDGPRLAISELFAVGGFAASSPYKNDFVELHNLGSEPAALGGLSLQFASGVSTTWSVSTLPDASVPAGGFFLVQLFGTDAGVNALPVPDAISTFNLLSPSSRVALVEGQSALTGVCPLDGGRVFLDFVGFADAGPGLGACFEGSSQVLSPASPLGMSRRAPSQHCVETDDNAADFTASAPNPQNSSSALALCGFDGGSASDGGQVFDGGGTFDAGTFDAGTFDAGAFDAGAFDAGAFDAGRIDAGTLDAGTLDAGAFDAGAFDAGGFDAGRIDAGPADGGSRDGGGMDAGPPDAGAVDAGAGDAGGVVDAGGRSDAGTTADSGRADAGAMADAGVRDAGGGDGGLGNVDEPRGCGCSASGPSALWLLAMGALLRRRKRA